MYRTPGSGSESLISFNYTCRTLIGVGLGQERGAEQGERGGYEKDIRDIVEYFERSCHVRDKLHRYHMLPAVSRIRRIRMFSSLPVTYLDLLVTSSAVPAPDPSTIE
jgi:hypothetical protein